MRLQGQNIDYKSRAWSFDQFIRSYLSSKSAENHRQWYRVSDTGYESRSRPGSVPLGICSD